MKRETITIPITIGEDYPTQLRNRLRAEGITNREVCKEIGWQESAFSRLFRPSAHNGEPVNPSLDTVVKIEQALLRIASRRLNAGRVKATTKK